MSLAEPILNVSFYRFVTLRDLERKKESIKSRAKEAGIKGSILLSEEGINGFLAAEESILRVYLDWLFSEYGEFNGMAPKESFSSKIPFARMIVKIKDEIIAMGRPTIRPEEKTGKVIDARTLKNWFDEKKEFVMLDTRNDYEISEGTFKNAVHYDIETFKEFPAALEKNAGNLADKTVVMFCTGGIRCEKATALAMDLGIQDVYQLDGGILKYFEEVGSAHYRGDCFVFDGRENVNAGLESRSDHSLRLKSEGLRLVHGDDVESNQVVYALRAKGLRFESVQIDSSHLPPEIAKANPHGKLPILENRDLVLYQPGIILDYLDENFPEKKSLTPLSPERRSRMRIWMDWVEHFFGMNVKKWCTERDALGKAEYRELEIRLEKDLYRMKTPLQRSRKFFVIDEPTQADIAAFSVLEKLRLTGFPSDFPERFDLVWAWYDRMAAISKAKSTSGFASPESGIRNSNLSAQNRA
ncbi:MAG: glutathione S-transferase N-terminal domain-containing protein [Cryobacterium sp.]|nr:glutathione S-transferase N-terminal domain-containing protein [Oligoflexia bacterium]